MRKQNDWDVLWWLEKKQLRSTIKNCALWIILYDCGFFYAATKSDTYTIFSMGIVLISTVFASRSFSGFAHLNVKFVLTAINDIYILMLIKYFLALIPTIIATFVMTVELLFLNKCGMVCAEMLAEKWVVNMMWVFVLPMYFTVLQFRYKFAQKTVIGIISIIIFNTICIATAANRYTYGLANILYLAFLCFHIYIMRMKITKECVWRGVKS